MLFKKLWRTMGLYKAQFISMIIMIALGVGVFVGFNMEWMTIDKNTSSFFEETNFADYRIYSDEGFGKDDLEKICAVKGVDGASRFLDVNAEVKGANGNSLALSVTENENVSGVYFVDGEEYDPQSENGIWLSDRYANANDISLGDKMTLVYKNIEFDGTVKGLIKASEHMICVRDESQLMPDYSTYGYAYISPKMYEKTLGTAYYPQLNVISKEDKKDFMESAEKALGRTTLILTKDENISYSGSKGEIQEGQTMGSVLPVLFLLIAVLTMVTTMHRLAAKEKTQIGTFKALGFKDKKIIRHYSSYAFIIGLTGTVLGVAIGCALAWMIMNPSGTMGAYMDMPSWKLYMPWYCCLMLAGIIAMLTFIGFLSVRKMLKGTAADALRPYTPKKVKPLLIEKTSLFHKLSFGTRWNLRDIMRHKSRTAMSLIGIWGCMTLIVGSMGMRDTMMSFLNTYYDEAMNYSSRIYIAENADRGERNSLIDKYSGDWSASVSVQIEDDKAVSLDVYSVKNGLLRFPGKDVDFLNIGDDGAYICRRIADEYNLSVGDKFRVSPYGSDKEYEMIVSDIAYSVSENIVVSPAYAQKVGIPYTVDSVYTKTDKSDIALSDTIKAVQSKQMVIDSFDSFMELMNTMIFVLVLGAMLLGVVVLYNLGVMSYTERYREMATLKVVGFKDKKIGRLLITQNLWMSVIGVLIGLPSGVFVLSYLMKELASEYELKIHLGPATYIAGIALTFGVSMLVSVAVAKKNKKIDMVEALKSAE